MAFETNELVSRLKRLQPFDADFGQIYFEYADHGADHLQTEAATTVARLVLDPRLTMVVLTGDAGHGKTHLCAQLLADLRGLSIAEVAEDVNQRGKGAVDLHLLTDGRALRIIRDLSEMDDDEAPHALKDSLGADNRVTVVCANEGRLRSAIHRGGADLLVLQDALDASIAQGLIRAPGQSVAMIDLNHQSVAAEREDNLISQLIDAWLIRDDIWTICDSCDARDRCPVLENRTLLAEEGAGGARRRSALVELFRVVEWTGVVITIRAMLIALAHAITGGLDCNDVENLVSQNSKDDWQWPYLYHQVIFGDRIPDHFLDRVEVFRGLRRLDPGLRANRTVDELLDDEHGAGGIIRPPVYLEDRSPTSRQQANLARTQHAELWRMLRRRSYFEGGGESELAAVRSRLGLEYVAEFEEIMKGREAGGYPEIRDQVLRGLEAIQGIHRSGLNRLAVVDPAFSNSASESLSGGAARIVAGELGLDRVEVGSLTAAWTVRDDSDGEMTVPKSIDWLERQVVVGLEPDPGHRIAIRLDLRDFEFVMGSADGLSSREFFAPQRRRVLRELAHVASVLAPKGGEVRVFADGSMKTLLIDGNLIYEED